MNNQCMPDYCPSGGAPVTYGYDLAGDMTSYTNGAGVTFNQAFDAAGRLTQITSNMVDPQHPGTLVTVDPSVGYYPSGALHKLTLGNGLTQTAVYSNRLQPCRMNVNSSGSALTQCADAVPSGNVQDFNYGFNLGTADNGNLASMVASGNQTFSRVYGYDALNRLLTMSAPADACSGLSWTYDAWGNRTDQTHTGGTCFEFHAAADTNNRLVGYSYDAAGNMTSDGNHTYTYDAENRLISMDGGAATYLYDALGRRTSKRIGTSFADYGYDLAGNPITEWRNWCGGQTCWGIGYVYLSGQLVAEYAAATTYFVLADHLGSTRLLTKLDQTVLDSMDYLPYGEQIAGDTGATHKFTGKERDSESGLDNFGARYFGSSMGRLMTPDAFYKDSHVADPQSWNEYAYARNNPLRYVDPNGEKADQSTNCTTTNNQTTCNVDISASIAVYSADGANLNQQQLNAAASQIQSSIQSAWSGSFTQDGVTYNVTTQISVSVAGSEADAMKSGAQNVIGLTNGNASATADSYVNSRSLFSAITGRGPDTGVFNINSLAGGVAAHEFTHLLGVENKPGAVLSNTNILNDPRIPHGATASDFQWGIREAVSGVNGWRNEPQFRSMRYGETWEKPSVYSDQTTVSASWHWWK